MNLPIFLQISLIIGNGKEMERVDILSQVIKKGLDSKNEKIGK